MKTTATSHQMMKFKKKMITSWFSPGMILPPPPKKKAYSAITFRSVASGLKKILQTGSYRPEASCGINGLIKINF